MKALNRTQLIEVGEKKIAFEQAKNTEKSP